MYSSTFLKFIASICYLFLSLIGQLMVAGLIGSHGQVALRRAEEVHRRASALATIPHHNMAAFTVKEAIQIINLATLKIAPVSKFRR